jgi:methionyl-tRNA formyltransferase
VNGSDFRIVFLGATEFGHRCCEALLRAGEPIAGIVSISEHFKISYSNTPVQNVTHRDFADLSFSYDVPLVEFNRGPTVDEYIQLLDEWNGTFGLAIGWFHMVPRQVREQFALGVVGVHASLLPRYRGGAPLVWAMLNGETETGVTLFYLDEGVDTGDIIAQRRVPILESETIAELYERSAQEAVSLLLDTVPLIGGLSAPRTPQDHSQATEFPQRSRADGLIDWSKSPEEIRNFIRAQTRPYPGAFTFIGGKRVTLWEADVDEVHDVGES